MTYRINFHTVGGIKLSMSGFATPYAARVQAELVRRTMLVDDESIEWWEVVVKNECSGGR